MSITQKKGRLLLLFLVALTIVNLVQALVTQLIYDEAYYWYFSRNLSWGYFDHPPMVAVFAFLGTTLFDNELGVRLFAPFLFSGTIFLLWKLIDDERKYKYTWLFCLLAGSVALFNVYGFFMLPDTPLLFFAALFLYGYKQFLKKENTAAILILAFSMAAMMYSKYHAILLIGFVILSNPKLLFRYRFWMAAALSLVLYIPHLYWLYETDFVSLKYHLSGRANSFYRIRFTLNYILNVLVVLGFSFPLIYWALYRYTRFGDLKNHVFDRALVFITWGIIVFFFLSSLNRKTQAQWPLLTELPLILLAFRYSLDREKFRKWLRITSIISLVVICMARVILVSETLSPISYETHGNKRWTQELYKKTDGLPVVFENSYRNASMYAFYTRVPVYSLNSADYRQSQFDIDSSEYRLQHKKVAYMSGRKDFDSIIQMRIGKGKGHPWKGKIIEDFSSFRKLICQVEDEKIVRGRDSISLTLTNPYSEGVAFENLKFYGFLLNEKKQIEDTINIYPGNNDGTRALSAESTIWFRAGLDSVQKLSNTKLFRVSISENDLPAGFQGNIIPIED
ncbi:ArnT family glycosyltransferase [Sinomicrobium weinanense]|uniref:Glycosyltransferase family 39 protein n=1 Tax=Sinomicrobium weinanense TaxID=2842200 RepID=A0A926JVE7_9FLAO|nr:glycosyltransferase family 39 protein [Sinomicrobium weinanense]MBC9797913.1 glycosyltransferase family 39 protein [Sinomicrobium weinanense]MBU3125450.1 glycosyltransferase family 39 protein [Sinomicrobium weinanense]